MTEHGPNSSSGLTVSVNNTVTAVEGSQQRSPFAAGSHGGLWNRLCCGSTCAGGCNRQSISKFLCANGCCCWYPHENARPTWNSKIYTLSKSTFWRLLYVLFSLFLLFGSPVQAFAVGSTGDTVFAVLRNIMLGYFIMDMFIRCMTNQDYFVCYTRARAASLVTPTVAPPTRSSAVGSGSGGNRHSLSYMDAKETHSPCIIGSFLFWCDLISTVTTLYDLTYVNHNAYGVREVEIGLDDLGRPYSGFDSYNLLRPGELEFNLLVVIARSTRCARFVQNRAVVGASNKINWFWAAKYTKWVNPYFYYQQYRQKVFQTRISTMGVATGDPGHFTSDVGGDQITDAQRRKWRMLQAGILAAADLRSEAETKGPPTSTSSGHSKKSIWNTVRKSMQSCGLMRSERSLAEKHIAATKLQRAWRRYITSEIAMSIDGNLTDGDSTTRPVRSYDKMRQKSTFSKDRKFGRLSSSQELRSKLHKAMTPGSRFQSQAGKGRESQVGTDMRKLTGQRVAIGTLFALLCTVLFTYTEANSSWQTTMVVLHTQTMYPEFQAQALTSAVLTSVPKLFKYQAIDGATIEIEKAGVKEGESKERDLLMITVSSPEGTSIGWFDSSTDTTQTAIVEIVATLFIILVWFFGVTAFSGPVLVLVITPIERMVRLLGMLMLDPLGYQSTTRFKRFLSQEEDIIKNTRWTKEVLKGMETSFLMSTILRIGSLMKVGFGSAGVEIIRNNLQKGQSKNSFILNSQGTTVSCIFLFCDIRQFTDATESLQEEVFVFTNRIAAVVHSICHSYGGAANKNVGDAFLLSWLLEDNAGGANKSSGRSGALRAKSNQADKALLSVIKICISLYFDKFYLEPLTELAKSRLKSKLKNRSGPVVQMGFGLHAGKAVQGAIGSPRKIDATYVSEAVERAEFLEASTKKYCLQMLMSGSFHALLHPNTKRRCRMIDKLFIVDEDEDADEDDDELHGERMDIYTFDMDIEALHRPYGKSTRRLGEFDAASDLGSTSGDGTRMVRYGKRGERRSHGSTRQIRNRRRSTALRTGSNGSEEFQTSASAAGHVASDSGHPTHTSTGQPSVVSSVPSEDNPSAGHVPPELVLPTGPALYSHDAWQSPDMKRIRDRYVQGLFFQKFHEGLTAFYSKDWQSAKICFQQVLDNVEDGPSRYFLNQMKLNNDVPPREFRGYGIA
ncbi:PAS domain containing protein [Nitzschia inconspicua]|uniref:PAS domain containing protein n=1 Tax=Nitzschia inconspicua TaxID=303405 RepID=A0A9K3Q2P5_9STRA|nr:PAS domain containing protein [Nitzschia inconspicua]